MSADELDAISAEAIEQLAKLLRRAKHLAAEHVDRLDKLRIIVGLQREQLEELRRGARNVLDAVTKPTTTEEDRAVFLRQLENALTSPVTEDEYRGWLAEAEEKRAALEEKLAASEAERFRLLEQIAERDKLPSAVRVAQAEEALKLMGPVLFMAENINADEYDDHDLCVSVAREAHTSLAGTSGHLRGLVEGAAQAWVEKNEKNLPMWVARVFNLWLKHPFTPATCPLCRAGDISPGHGKCTSCNANFIEKLPKTPNYLALRWSFAGHKEDASR